VLQQQQRAPRLQQLARLLQHLRTIRKCNGHYVRVREQRSACLQASATCTPAAAPARQCTKIAIQCLCRQPRYEVTADGASFRSNSLCSNRGDTTSIAVSCNTSASLPPTK
jgi:hypothetical protein